MEDFKKRLEDERAGLVEKLNKLNSFIGTPNFNKLDITQKSLLQVQAQAMATYLTCLSERLVRL